MQPTTTPAPFFSSVPTPPVATPSRSTVCICCGDHDGEDEDEGNLDFRGPNRSALRGDHPLQGRRGRPRNRRRKKNRQRGKKRNRRILHLSDESQVKSP